MPCSSSCAASVSISGCPPERAVTSLSSAGSLAFSPALPAPSATSFTARCATGLWQ
ncbi:MULTISPECIES: hypothetical protein [unclassified Sphingomonas]|uniref:hypothetical protein n=1 Tax=unclassified Sphingomonas TaxID=196159 RepID=UPI000A427DFB|nr:MULTISPECIES: hypothetical protein [unclassified Sphingomonas]